MFGMDFAPLIPPGVGIKSGTLKIFTNASPARARRRRLDRHRAVTWLDRTLYATLGGGKSGVDYMLTWTATDTQGNVWPRSALVLCAPTS